VQRLRKRLSHEESSQSGKGSLPGRVPSFYTSRSIVNLSGLSVSDPLPGEQSLTQEDAMQAILSSRKGSRGGEGLPREQGLGTVSSSLYVHTGQRIVQLLFDCVYGWTLPDVGVSADDADLSLANDCAMSPEDPEEGVGNDWYNIAAVGSDEPLQNGKPIQRENSGPLFRRSASGNLIDAALPMHRSVAI
jgi:hypothetical protein